MDKFIEEEQVLTIGNRSFDVSNIPTGKKKVSRRIWDNMVRDFNRELEESNNTLEVQQKYNDIIYDIYNSQGVYLIRQSFIVLKRRYGFLATCKEIIKRAFLSVRYLNSLSDEELEPFREWIHFNITGVKKKEIEATNQIQKIELEMLKEIEALNLKPETLTKLLQTFLRETAGNMNISVPLQKR